MALFEQKNKKKTFAEQLSDVKSVFKKACDEALDVVQQCNNHITIKEEEVKKLETEIRETETVKVEALSFISKLKDLA